MKTASGMRLLVIEDESSVQAFLRAALERFGYEVVLAGSGAQGLEELKHGEFSGVISDMRTPGGVGGADVHEWLLKNKPELAKHLLFITGDVANEETMTTLQKTGVPCIEKPFRVQELMEAVKKVLEQ